MVYEEKLILRKKWSYMSFKIKYPMNKVFIKGKQKLEQHSMMKYSLHYETWSFRNIYPLFFKIYIFEMVIISAIPLVVEEWSYFGTGPGSFELYSIHIFSAFFMCWNICYQLYINSLPIYHTKT